MSILQGEVPRGNWSKSRKLMKCVNRLVFLVNVQVEDVVMVNVRAIAEMGAYVYLLEYNSIEGMILLSELSRRRIRSINKLIRVGKTEPVVVIRVDKEKGKCFSEFAINYSRNS